MVWNTLKSFKNKKSSNCRPPTEENKERALAAFNKVVGSPKQDKKDVNIQTISTTSILHQGYADLILRQRENSASSSSQQVSQLEDAKRKKLKKTLNQTNATIVKLFCKGELAR